MAEKAMRRIKQKSEMWMLGRSYKVNEIGEGRFLHKT